jgi:hypothetical protein
LTLRHTRRLHGEWKMLINFKKIVHGKEAFQ